MWAGRAGQEPAAVVGNGRRAVQVLVVGTGVVGSVLGWQLAEAGHEVTHLVRPGRAAALAWSGLRISGTELRAGPDQRPGRGAGRGAAAAIEAHYRPVLIETPADAGYDFVLAPVWPEQLAPLAQQLAGYGVGGEMVFMGAWSGGGDELLPFLSPERFLCAYPGVVGGERQGYRVRAVLAGGARATAIGELDGRITHRLERLDELLASADLRPAPSRRIGAVLAVQYVQQAAPLGALWGTAGRGGLALDEPAQARQALGALREGMEVCRAWGHEPEEMIPWALLRLPLFWAARLYASLQRGAEAQRMLAGPAVHGAAHLAAAYEEILAAGERLGMAMPYWRAGLAAVAAHQARAQGNGEVEDRGGEG
jgi:2-dehydropantoate 2-reductase